MEIPKGTTVVRAAQAMHEDSAIYESALEMRPWRFVAQDEETKSGTDNDDDGHRKQRFGAVSSSLINFGYGRHAW